jgi:hypothetical protein
LDSGGAHPLEQLSARALMHVAAIQGLVEHAAADRLYRLNSQPLTPAHVQLLPNAEAVARYLGLAPIPPGYSGVVDKHWLHFRHRAAAGPLVFKLYLSTVVQMLPVLISEVVPVLVVNAVPAFKVGADAAGLVRPDHFVLYFANLEHRDHVATELAMLLVPPVGLRFPMLGVPFAAAVAADHSGLIGSGFDPPGQSHRGWLTKSMGRALGLAEQNPSARLAVMRDTVRVGGLCPDRFSPIEES